MSSEDQQGRVAGRIALVIRAARIRCNAILPAFIDTQILDPLMPSTDPETRKKVLDKLACQIPLGLVGDPEDVASDESRFMTGSSLLLDGGISAR